MGIVWGLYIKISIVPFWCVMAAIYFFTKKGKNKNKKLLIFNPKRYFRYLRLFLTTKTILIIAIFSIVANLVVNIQNKKFETIYKDNQEVIADAIVENGAKESDYYSIYKIKIIKSNISKSNNTYVYLKVKKNENKLEYGDKIHITGTFQEPERMRNFKGFDYKNYLKTLKIYGTIKCSTLNVIGKNSGNIFIKYATICANKIKERIELCMPKKEAELLKGLLIGDISQVNEEIKESFKISSLTHVLAVSGMQVTYIMIGVSKILNKLVGKSKARIFTIICLIFYAAITDFSPSIVRATIMGIILVGANMFHRKNDIWNTIFLSLLLMLIYNPFLILNAGLQLSYLGTMGIVLFYSAILKILNNIRIRNRKLKYKINLNSKYIQHLKEVLALTLSAQISVMPIIIYSFNMVGTYFIVTNLLVAWLIGPITILGTAIIFVSYISIPIAKLISYLIKILINILISISQISNLPFSKFYFPTPNIATIISIYVIFIILKYVVELYVFNNLSITQRRFRNLLALLKYKVVTYKKKIVIIISIIVIIANLLKIIPKELEINFVDVGQGDSTFIVTPRGKSILIDGGGSSTDDFDVGKSTLLPYILDRGYTTLDFVIISHFDNDHVGGILTILQELKVKNIIIGKQFETCENYDRFIKIVQEKNIKVFSLEAGNIVNIEKDVKIYALWPNSNIKITENSINNNSFVCKIMYKNFSLLCTGDIEEIAEKKILDMYKDNQNVLQADVLKVAHHGSKSSSILEFLKAVKPKIALIGVGKNNLFGHPSDITINNLKKEKIKIFRTDENGEITLRLNKENIKIDTIN